MQFPDSTFVALNLASNEPPRFGRTLLAALVLTAGTICMALWVELDMFGSTATVSQIQSDGKAARTTPR